MHDTFAALDRAYHPRFGGLGNWACLWKLRSAVSQTSGDG